MVLKKTQLRKLKKIKAKKKAWPFTAEQNGSQEVSLSKFFVAINNSNDEKPKYPKCVEWFYGDHYMELNESEWQKNKAIQIQEYKWENSELNDSKNNLKITSTELTFRQMAGIQSHIL